LLPRGAPAKKLALDQASRRGDVAGHIQDQVPVEVLPLEMEEVVRVVPALEARHAPFGAEALAQAFPVHGHQLLKLDGKPRQERRRVRIALELLQRRPFDVAPGARVYHDRTLRLLPSRAQKRVALIEGKAFAQ